MTVSRLVFLPFLLLSASLAACGGRALDLGNTDSGTLGDAGPTSRDDGATGPNDLDGGATDPGDDTTPFPIGPEVITAAQVAAAKKTCEEPHGTIDTYGSTAEATALISGVWYACPSTDDGGVDPDFGAGIQFAANGSFYMLELDAKGGLVASAGLEDTGTWQVQQEGGGTSFTYPMAILQTWGDGSSGEPYLYFEQNPARWDYGGAFDQWFVRFSP